MAFRQQGFSLLEMMIVVTIIGIIASFVVPGLLESTMAAREASALADVRSLVKAQATFSVTKGFGQYASNLTQLGQAELIDSVLAAGAKGGYTFSLTGDGSIFEIQARPLSYGTTGGRNFFADTTGVIRYTTQDRAATSADPPA